MGKEKIRKNRKECLTKIFAFYQTLGTKVFGFLFICSFAVVLGACGSPEPTEPTEPTEANCSQSVVDGCSLPESNHNDMNVAGTCGTGYTGTCSYNCNEEMWEQATKCFAQCPADFNIGTCSSSSDPANHGESNGTCATDYTGTCSLNCNDGMWEPDSNSCFAQCPADFNIGTCSSSSDPANHGESNGTCATDYTGTCSLNCNDGMWEPDSNSCFAQCPADFNIGTCSSSSDPANHGESNGTCATDYTGTCSLNCNDGMWEEDSNSCFAQCPADFNIGTCSSSSDPANHGESNGTCATDYTGTCSLNCNDGMWAEDSNMCFAQCPADSDIHTCSSSSNPANHNDMNVAGSCATGYTGTCSLNCNDGMWTSNENMCDADTDTDNDGIADMNDLCRNSLTTDFTSSPSNDIDRDGCEDAFEDVDDDGDGLIEITTPAMLNDMRYNPAGNRYATSTGDTGDNSGCGGKGGIIVCNGYELSNNIPLMEDWPVITGDFTGTFDGKGFSISGLTFSSDNVNVGFFAQVSGIVRNVRLTGSTTVTSISTNADSTIGSLVGQLNSGGRVFSSSSSISVTATSSSESVGGLVGRNNGGTIRNSSVTGSVNGSSDSVDVIGGLVGHSNAGTIQNSYATGNVNGSNGSNVVGGLVGQIEGSASIANSYAIGDVNAGTGNNIVGGLVGQITTNASIENSYATGDVNAGNGDDYVGGLVGLRILGRIANSYAIGDVNAGTGDDVAGGLVGEDFGTTIPNSYRNSDATILGTNTNTLGIDKSVTQLQARTNMVPDNNDSCLAAGGTYPSGGPCQNGRYNGWSTDDWVFEANKFPTLKSNAGTNLILCGQNGDYDNDNVIDWVAPPENQCP